MNITKSDLMDICVLHLFNPEKTLYFQDKIPDPMAYSSKINDPAFDKYRTNTRNYRLQFSLVLAVAAVAGFFLYGHFSDEMDNPEALYIGLAIGGMFFLIGLYSALSGRSSLTWDGKVTGKKIRRVGGKLEYVVTISDGKGHIHEVKTENDKTLYDYYSEGEKVRFHGRLHSFEKYDKSKDEIIFCNACAFMHEISDDFCRNCGCPLLK